MKTSRLILTTLLTLGLFTLAPAGHAAKLGATDKAAQRAEKAAQRADKQAGGLKTAGAKDLNLTPEQKQKLKELAAQRRAKTQALQDEFEKKLAGILTPEQLSKYKELNAKSAAGSKEQPAQTTQPKRKKKDPAAKDK